MKSNLVLGQPRPKLLLGNLFADNALRSTAAVELSTLFGINLLKEINGDRVFGSLGGGRLVRELAGGQVEGEGGFGDVSDVDCEVDDVLFGLAVAGALGPGDYW